MREGGEVEENESNTKGEGSTARWNLNVLKPEQDQQQHHNRHHLLCAQSEEMEHRERSPVRSLLTETEQGAQCSVST